MLKNTYNVWVWIYLNYYLVENNVDKLQPHNCIMIKLLIVRLKLFVMFKMH